MSFMEGKIDKKKVIHKFAHSEDCLLIRLLRTSTSRKLKKLTVLTEKKLFEIERTNNDLHPLKHLKSFYINSGLSIFKSC